MCDSMHVSLQTAFGLSYYGDDCVGLWGTHHHEAVAAGGNICDNWNKPEGCNLDVQ